MDNQKVEEYLEKYQSSSVDELTNIVDKRGNYQIEASYAALKRLLEDGLENRNEYEAILKEEYESQLKWFYEFNGKRIGEVLPIEIKILIENGQVDRSTKVWNKQLTDWKPICETELNDLIGHELAPPPLEGDSVNNRFIWLLAFAPILTYILEYFLFGGEKLWFALAVNTVIAFLDEQMLKRAGHNVKKWSWSIFVVPVYLWIRSSKTKQSKITFWLWLIFFVGYLVFG